MNWPSLGEPCPTYTGPEYPYGWDEHRGVIITLSQCRIGKGCKIASGLIIRTWLHCLWLHSAKFGDWGNSDWLTSSESSKAHFCVSSLLTQQYMLSTSSLDQWTTYYLSSLFQELYYQPGVFGYVFLILFKWNFSGVLFQVVTTRKSICWSPGTYWPLLS